MLGGTDGEGAGFGIAMSGLNGGRINIAACSLGGAQTAYHKAAAYVRDREAFGGSASRRAHDPLHIGRYGHRSGVVAIAVVAGGNRARRRPPRQGRAVRDGQAVRHRRLLSMWPIRRCSCTAATAISRVRPGEDRPRSAGAPDPRGNQRNHARGHRSGRSGPCPRSANQEGVEDRDDRVLGVGQHGRPDGGEPRRGRPHRAGLRSRARLEGGGRGQGRQGIRHRRRGGGRRRRGDHVAAQR